MRDRYTVTVTDYRGARHFNLSQLMGRMLGAFGTVVTLGFIAGAFAIYLLSSKVATLNSDLQTLEDYQAHIKIQNQELLHKQKILLSAVDEKVEALGRMSDELGDLEILIGLKPEQASTLSERLDSASLTAQQKRTMLESIPSGLPLRQTHLTSNYGMRIHPILNRKAMHGGLDMSAALGTPIYATANGVVEWAAPHKSSGLGNMVKLNHNYGFSSTFGHLSKILVRSGDYVQRGDLIGQTGNTGMSSAPHLHYEIRYLHRRLNPKPFTEWSFENYDVLFKNEGHIQWDSLAESVRKAVGSPERLLLQGQPKLSVISN
ncbi:MAG: murein DD-endopeptidase MepM/ murein hydrolase activator NlpD [Bermanella sp.]|jgi:murein DD-endopeptidase MepM/ murein hydrolase activator NlpD